MFNWWMGRPAEGTQEDENSEIDPPETPAHLFAVRALKRAAFGTPAPPHDETMIEDDTTEQEEWMTRNSTKTLQSGSISPTKPPGILLTPGTATSRRKTVSFGHEVLDKTEKNANGKTTTKDAAGKSHSSIETKPDQHLKPTRLTRAFENAREGKTGRAGSDKPRGSFESQPLLGLDSSADDKEASKGRLERRASNTSKSNQDLMQELMTGPHSDGDMTMDLNEPHSQSGMYWKSEFERYHDEAQAEMKNLTRYRNLAKSYAKKKDAEALSLAEKLKEEQKRVVSMEDKISKLSAKMAMSGLEGQEDNSPVMIKELARQTALAVQYRAQVEEFRKALEGNDHQTDARTDGKHYPSPSKERGQSLLDTHQELKNAREQLKGMDAVRDELRDLKKKAFATEGINKKVQEENVKLTQELLHADLRLEKEIEKSEKRRLVFQERLQKKDEALQSLQKDYDSLKEAAKSQRRDAEHLLKKRHDQVVELKKELASKKSAESTAKDLQQALQEKTAEHNKIVSDYQRQIERLINTQAEDLQNMPMITLPTNAALTQTSDSSRMAVNNNENPPFRDSQIPVLSQSITRPLKALAATKNARSDTAAGSRQPQSSQAALSDITNCASLERLPPQISSPGRYTPMADRFENLSLESPKMDLPSPEPFVPSQPPRQVIHEKNYQPSPRPSMFVIPSSPPKRAIMRSRTSGELARQKSINALANASSRLSSLEGSRTRNTLPPERAAAAKARLEQKNAEKKRVQSQALGTNKENIRD